MATAKAPTRRARARKSRRRARAKAAVAPKASKRAKAVKGSNRAKTAKSASAKGAGARKAPAVRGAKKTATPARRASAGSKTRKGAGGAAKASAKAAARPRSRRAPEKSVAPAVRARKAATGPRTRSGGRSRQSRAGPRGVSKQPRRGAPRAAPKTRPKAGAKHAPSSALMRGAKPASRGRVAASGLAIRQRAAPRAGSRTARSTGRRAAPALKRVRGRIAPAKGVAVGGAPGPRYDEILTPGALAFLAGLHRRFEDRRRQLLAERIAQQERYDAGMLPDFLETTRAIREGDWKVAPIPPDLIDRRVEITGPVDRKMVINALNSGANVYMADFEDANSPTWANIIEGQINLKDRWSGTLAFTDEETGRDYRLNGKAAVLIVRPRGWHLTERHLTVDGEPISGALFDFGLYLYHNVRSLIDQGTGPYFYLPKLETHPEARLWNDVFVHAQEEFGLPAGTIKATVLIETLPAAFEMDEILYELRDHVVGLNAGRWDYIFSFIKSWRTTRTTCSPIARRW